MMSQSYTGTGSPPHVVPIMKSIQWVSANSIAEQRTHAPGGPAERAWAPELPHWGSCRAIMDPRASSLGVLCGPSKSARSPHTYLTESPGPKRTRKLSSHPEHSRKVANILLSWEMTCVCSWVRTCVKGRDTLGCHSSVTVSLVS